MSSVSKILNQISISNWDRARLFCKQKKNKLLVLNDSFS